jgi:hypothetical protein
MRWTTWVWARLLLMLDRLLGTRLVERELARRQAAIERLVARVEAVNRDLEALAEELAFYRLAVCLAELKARSEREGWDDWLCFAPHSDGDELLLDSAIECLVKPRLAAIDAEPAGPGNYIYRLHLDWAAIIARVRGTALASELMAWLEEQA